MSINYDNYSLSKEETIRFFSGCLIVGLTVGKLFYESLFIGVTIGILIGFWFPYYKIKVRKKRKARLLLQFRDLLYGVASSLSAGRNMENALAESREFLQGTYERTDDIIKELDLILRKIREGQEEDCVALKDFANRSGLEDVRDFVTVYTQCKGSGGNMPKAIQRATTLIGDKICLESELEGMMKQKMFEGRIVALAPFVMVFFMKLSAPEYMDIMMETATGKVLSTISIGLIICGILLIERMNQIEI